MQTKNLISNAGPMPSVPVRKLVYLLAGTGVEAVTSDRSIHFQVARVWPYKAVNATTGAATANAGAITFGQSGLPISVTVTMVVLAGIATATATAHGLYEGEYVTVSGATPSGCNGTFRITEVTANTFKYRCTAADGVATGTITAAKQAALPHAIAAATVTPLEIKLPLGQKRPLADLVLRGTATDGCYVEWE